MNLHTHAKKFKIGAAALVLLGLSYMAGHHAAKSTVTVIPLAEVTVQKPQLLPMTEYVVQTGTTVSYNSVNLVARVEGYLDTIAFTDGTFVKKGQPLLVIQPDTYLQQLKAAEATVAAQKAANVYAKSEYARQKRMYKDNATSLNNVESWLAKTEESDAEIAKALADEEIARINYGYTHIAAPFDGRMGRHLIDVGNLVGNGVATVLATIDQIDKLYVYFNLNEIDLLKLRAAVRSRGLQLKEVYQIPVDVRMQNETDYAYKATLNFVNTGLNASTGTMELRALLDNKDYHFVPGLFVEVRIALTHPIKQLTVPDTAVLYDQIGSYLLVVDSHNTVLQKRCVLGSLDKGMRSILKGLNPSDRVIIAGLQNASPGNTVNPRMQSVGKSAL